MFFLRVAASSNNRMHSNKQGRAAVPFAKFLVKRIICKNPVSLLVGDAKRYIKELMDTHDRIKQIKKVARNDKEAIEMLLCASADMGSEQGALLSIAKFDDAAKLILEYFADRLLIPATIGNEDEVCVVKHNVMISSGA